MLPAVILADSFDEFYRPVTLVKPRALFPLVGIPVLNHTIEFLASNSVTMIYIYTCSLSDIVQSYLQNSQWKDRKDVQIKVIVNNESSTVGDAMRALHDSGYFREDFILVNGDLLSNISLEKVVKAHLNRRKKDRESIMTVVLKEAYPGHQTRSNKEDITVAYETKNNQMLHYSNERTDKNFSIPFDVIEQFEYNNVQCRYDVLDCNIAVCHPEVLFQFQENFDYKTVSQFIVGVIREEILSAKVHCHFVEKGEYAARVDCLRTYKAVHRDIINRWTYPIVPDNNAETSYTLSRFSIYKEKNVTLSRSCVIGRETTIGMNTTIGDNTNIKHSVIGRNCTIGKNVTINGAIIWDGVTIQDNVTIIDSLLCDNTTINEGSTISPGCVISFDVVVGSGIILDPLTKLTLQITPYNEEIDLGDGHGYLWTPQYSLPVGTELVPTDEDHALDNVSSSDSEVEDVEEQFYISTRENFLAEMYDCISVATKEDKGREQTGQEIRSLKFTYVVDFLDVVEGMVIAIFNMAFQEDSENLMKGMVPVC
eukprot:TRINITY_DN4468_c0_g1_i1.p1 TRINITY_DN4468_c0_g1~~TRINITY_DN4468_c0_g1_i1.p1  ORF type:complete len:538 (+),score=113.70 TRINITY_DN4468_c0_g1_i1:24-1637(+)